MKGMSIERIAYVLLPVAATFILILIVTNAFDIVFPNGGNGHEPLPDTVIFSLASPKVTERQLDAYLQANAGFRLRSKAKVFYDKGLALDIDPAFALAVSQHETSLGKSPCLGASLECNNFFCLSNDAVSGSGLSEGKCGSTDFASFEDADKAIEAFFASISDRFVEKRMTQDTVSRIGCERGSGFNTNCYCSMSGSDCLYWSSGVFDLVRKVRNYGT